MESRKVKTWVKTTIFLIIGVAIFALLALSGLVPWRDRQELSSTIFLEIIAFGWLVFVILGSVYGHKRKWKSND